MKLSANDKTTITRFFNKLHQTYGNYSAYSLGWSSKEIQVLRFKILCGVGDIENSKVLDVGCGLGDLYGYIELLYKDVKYKGIDITPSLITAAKEKYPDADFSLTDIFELSDNSFDYAFASGVFSYNIPNYLDKYFAIIKKMFSITTKGVAFNLLNKQYHDIDEVFMAYDPEEIRKECLKITDNIKVIRDYLDQDFTIYLYH